MHSDEATTDERRAKALAALFSVGLLLAVLSPIRENWKKKGRDDFPLSYYPMFTSKRRADYRQSHVIGVNAQGKQIFIPHGLIGDGGLNQTRRQLNRILKSRDEKKIDEHCRAIAERVAQSNKSAYKEIVTIQIVTSTYRLSDYFSKRMKEPLEVRIRAFCPVERSEP